MITNKGSGNVSGQKFSAITWLVVFLLSLTGSWCSGVAVPLSEAVTTVIPSVNGVGVFCEIYLGVGGGYPAPATIASRTPNADLLSPVVDFPSTGNDVSIGSSFQAFFNNTIYAPDAVRNLNPSGFILKGIANLKITQDLDINTATPEIDIQIRIGCDDGHYLVVGNQFLGNSPDHAFTWYAYPLTFEGPGLYPLYFLFSANNAGVSGLELQWQIPSGWQVIPQSALYQSTAGCEQQILFEEYAAGTPLTDQYSSQGALFTTLSGNIQITDAFPLKFVPVSGDRVLADPTESPTEEGLVAIHFVDPVTGHAAITNYFSCYVIDAESTGATITAYGPDGSVLDSVSVIDAGGGAAQVPVEINTPGIFEIVASLGIGSDTSALDNLCWSIPASINLPDLQVVFDSAPSSAYASLSIPITCTVTNHGDLTGVSTWSDNIYLSSDQTLDGSDILLATRINNTPLDLNESYVINESIPLPDNVDGEFYLIVYTDADDAVEEYTLEDNNQQNSNVMTIVIDNVGPSITNHTPKGLIKAAVDFIDLTFSEPIQSLSFDTDDILLTNPGGNPVTIDSITDQGGNTWRMSFSPQSATGQYDLSVGPDILDIATNPMAEAYTGSFWVNASDEDDVVFISVSGGYNADGVHFHQTVADAGANTTYFLLNSSSQSTIADYIIANVATIDQIWIYDLSSGSDGYNTAYQAIANWFDASRHQIICDGRIISSYWSNRYQNEGKRLSQNYYENLKLNGGGIFLGTDHNAYHSGINTINSNIGINPFVGNFSLTKIPVDTQSPLMTYPNYMGTELFDDSSPGQTPYGLQPNGMILYSLAWHSGNVNTPGISTTIEGLVGFHVDINQPANNATFLVTDTIHFAASSVNAGGTVTYTWTSSLDGELGQGQTLDTTLSPGAHTITLLGEDSGTAGADTEIISITVNDLPDLQISNLTTDTQTYAGKSLNIGWMVTNTRSKAAAAAWRDSVYLSADNQAGDDILLANVDRPSPLGQDQSYNQNQAVTIPSDTPSGQYWIVVKADSANAIQETNENNNTIIDGPVDIKLLPEIGPMADLDRIAGNAYISVTPTLTQGTPPITWSLVAGPDGAQIDSGTGVVTWTNPVVRKAPYTFTIQAGNDGGSDQTSWKLTVVDTPVINAIPDHTVSSDRVYNGPVPTLETDMAVTWSLVSGPDGMTINPEFGVVTWSTPVTSTTPYTITIKASNIAGSDEESWQIQVLDQLQIDPINDSQIAEGVPFQVDANLTQGSEPVTWSLINAPAGMTIDNNTGLISWPSPVARIAPYAITVRAANPVGSVDEAFNLTVVLAPSIYPIGNQTVNIGSSYKSAQPELLKPTAVTWALVSGPAGMTINTVTGVLTWSTPDPTGNPYIITISAANVAGSDEESWQLSVLTPPIVADIINTQIVEHTPYSVIPSLLQGTNVAWSLVQAPDESVTIDPATGELTWPDPAPRPDPYKIIIRASNNEGFDLEEWDVTVLTIPVIQDISDAKTATGKLYTGPKPQLLPPTNVVWSLVTGPAGMTINQNDGKVSWPSPVKEGQPFTVTIAATNDAGSDQETWLLEVLDTPEIASIANTTVVQFTQYASIVPSLTKGQDTTVTWSLVDRPAGMSIDPATGQVSWSSAIPGTAPYKITIRASNDVGYGQQSWMLEVLSSPDINEIPNSSVATNSIYAVTATLIRGTKPVTWSVVSGPAGLTIDSATGHVVWSNPSMAGSPYEITVRATNSYGQDDETWTLTVMDIPDVEPMADDATPEGSSWQRQPNLLAGSSPITWTLASAPVGMTINTTTGALNWDKAVATQTPYTISVRASNAVGSDVESFKLAVPVTYTATVQADIEREPSGTPVVFTGSATWLPDGQSPGEPAANVDVNIRITVQGTTRIVKVKSDLNGQFTQQWQPLGSEAGYYTVTADHPAIVSEPTEDEFILVGMKAEPIGMRHQVKVGTLTTGSVIIQNLGNVPLTSITPQINNAPANLDIQITNWPQNLDGLGTGSMDYTIDAADASVREAMPEIQLTSSEGGTVILPLAVRVTSPLPSLVANPTSLSSGMVRGKQTLIQFQVTNQGNSPTAQLDVLLPSSSWLKLASPAAIPPLQPDASATVILALTPSDDPINPLPLGIYEGTIAVNGLQTGVSVPFTFNNVSEGRGDLKIICRDEFSYLAADKPMLADAVVTLTDPITRQTIDIQASDASGIVVFNNLQEAYYDVEVTADGHGGFGTTVLATAGKVTEVEAFLARQTVTYNWTVKPTVIEDRYIFTIEAVFETNVPVPVVTVEPALLDLEAMEVDQMQVDYTITNHGLITAEDVDIVFGDTNLFSFTPLVDVIGDIPAQSSVTVPVIVTKLSGNQDTVRSFGENASTSPAVDCVTKMVSFVGYTYECGPDHRWHRVPFYFRFPVTICTGTGGPGGGGGYPIGGGGGIWGGAWGPGGGWSPDVPVLTHDDFEIEESCNPCANEILKQVLNCALSFLPLDCGTTIIKSVYECASACSTSFDFNCAKSCVGGALSTIISCGGDAAKKLGPWGIAWNVFWCSYDITSAIIGDKCIDLYGSGSGGSSPAPANRLDTLSDQLLLADDNPLTDSGVGPSVFYLQEQALRLQRMIAPMMEIFGEVWFQGVESDEESVKFANFMIAFESATKDESDEAGIISLDEAHTLRNMPLPIQTTAEDVDILVERWNRTMMYWEQGITTVDQVPEGLSTDFIDYSVYTELLDDAQVAIDEHMAEGYTDLLEGVNYARNVLQQKLEEPDEGVCARVKIRIEQEAVISRNAFEAVLELGNEGPESLTDIHVTIDIRDEDGNPSNDYFGIHPPDTTGLTGEFGSWALAGNSQGTASWIIVPNQLAAPTEPKQYYVRGILNYTLSGSQVSIPLYPAPITVLPNPNLVVKYFLERDVYSDDPFTPDVVEPAIPFSLGLMMTNTGAGIANNVRITSSQPEIIENEKGLLIDFEIISSRVGTEEVSPSLTVNLGDIDPGASKVAQWLMISSLQGKFVEYSASFEHVDGLGDPRLSLVESVEIHETEHVVRVDNPIEDDALPDFLTNDKPDIDDLPDKLHLSDGTVEPVSAVTESLLAGPAIDGGIYTYQLQVDMPAGWTYVRVPDPANNQYQLVSVTRVSDGQPIRVTDNAWTTHKVVRKQGQSPYDENLFHLFDYGLGVTETYTVTYTLFDTEVPQAQALVIDDIVNVSTNALDFAIVYSDDVAIDGASFNSRDIRVTGPHGFNQLAKFIGVDVLGNGSPRTATYRITPPDGSWNFADNGEYTLSMEPGQVFDTSANTIPAGTLTTFNVNIVPDCDVQLVSWNLIKSIRVSRNVYQYEYSITLRNNCVYDIYDVLFDITDGPSNVWVLINRNKASFDVLPANSTLTSSGTLILQVDHSSPFDLADLDWQLLSICRQPDFNKDLVIDLTDLQYLIDVWLTDDATGDIAPLTEGDGVVNTIDFALLSRCWLNNLMNPYFMK